MTVILSRFLIYHCHMKKQIRKNIYAKYSLSINLRKYEITDWIECAVDIGTALIVVNKFSYFCIENKLFLLFTYLHYIYSIFMCSVNIKN